MDPSFQLKRLIRQFGYDIVGFDPRFSLTARKQHLIRFAEFDTFVDIGANIGQFACLLRKNGFYGEIHSIEPGTNAFTKLVRNCENDPLWFAYQFACGCRQEQRELFISENSHSSSLLPNSRLNLKYHPDTKIIDREVIDIRRLDRIIGQIIPVNGPFGLKIDTQGFESDVLQGSSGIIDQVELLIIEFSLCALQESQLLFHELLPDILAMGFRPVVIEPCDTDPESFEILQIDVWFTRASKVSL